MKYIFTEHFKKRYIERINDFSKDGNLYLKILKDLKSSENITGKIANEVPRFILYIKERYGNNINILKCNNTIFIISKIKGTSENYSVITCFNEINYLDNFKNCKLTRNEIFHRLKMLKTNG